MTTGEKLAKLRKERNYTQEQLADILGVSRQSVSKWESDIAYPETDKLVKLGELYGCSMDYLLKDGYDVNGKPEEPQREAERKPFDLINWHFERKSKREFRGVPLWHINFGLGKTAKGIFAIGFAARGVFSFGLLSLGVFSFGVLSLGILAFGVAAFGLASAGAIAAGIIAAGAISLGILSVGAMAIGDFSVGALAVGKYFALGDHAYGGTVAIGRTLAQGTYTAQILGQADADTVSALLDENVPAIFALFKKIVMLLF